MELTNKIINCFLALSAAAGLGAGGMYLYHRDSIKGGADYKLIKECEAILKENGMEFPDEVTKEEAALNGYLAAYGDKYTFYSHSDGIEEYLSAINNISCLVTSGYQVGLGESGKLVVTKVEQGSVAEKQGLKVGDSIISVDSVSVAGEGINKAAWELSGKDGTTMHLVIERDGNRRELDFVRANDENRSVTNVMLDSFGEVLYIKITSFDEFTPALLNGKLEEYDKDYSKIIIDLRNNPGGLVSGAVGVADTFIKEGVVTKHFANGEVVNEGVSDSGNELNMPMVVLVNEKTISAAEILTALLKQYGEDVKLVGTKTYGKGIFQKEKELSNGGIIRYTAGYITVGDWDCYQGKGIEPDYEVETDSSSIGTNDDIQLKKALKLLS